MAIQNIIEVDEIVNEYDFTTERRMLFDIQCATPKKNFCQRNVEVHVMKNRNELYPFIENFIGNRSDIKNIAFSDGVTLYELNLFNWVNQIYQGKPSAAGGVIMKLINL